MTTPPARDRKVLFAALALGLVALCWGTSFAVIKDIIGSIPPFGLMMLRFGLSTLLLGAFFGGRLRTLTAPQLGRSVAIGGFLTAAFVALVLGIRHTTASNQSFLVGACVIFVPFLGWLVSGKRPGGFAVAGALLATLGIALLTLDATFAINRGDLLSLLCSVAYAAHMVAIERLGRDVDPIASTLVQFLVATLTFTVLTATFESVRFPMSPKLWIAVAYLAVFTTVIAFTIQNVAQRFLSSTSTALILTLETAFGGIFAVLYLREQLTAKMLVGCGIILVGILTEQTEWRFLRRS